MKNNFLFIVFIFIMFFCFNIKIDALELEDGIYAISSALDNNKVLTIAGDKINSGSNVELNTFDYGDSQKWNVKKVDDGYYIITSVDDNLVLEVQDSVLDNGSNIQINENINVDSQRWFIKETNNGYYNIISKYSDLYVDVKGVSSANGTNIITWEGNDGKNQKFNFFKIDEEKQGIENGTYFINSTLTTHSSISSGFESVRGSNIYLEETNSSYNEAFNIKYLADGYYKISLYNSDLVLGINGNNVELVEDEKWLIRENIDGSYGICTKDNYCLDIKGANSEAGTNVQLYQSNGTNAQKFSFVKADFTLIRDGVYNISSINDDIVLGINNFIPINEVNVKLENKTNENNQKWYIKNVKDNIYQICSVIDTDYVLDVYGSKINNGTKVQIYKNHDSDNQKWYVVKLEDGTYHFTNIKSFKNLDIYGGNIKDGSNLEQYENHYGNAQKFKLSKTSINEYEQFIEDSNYIIYTSVNLNKSVRGNYINDVEGTNLEKINISYDKNGFYVLKNGNKAYTNDNGKLVLTIYNGGDNQKWFAKKTGDYFTFYSKMDGKVMDVPNFNVKNGTAILTWKYNGGSNQKFYLEAIKDVSLNNGYYKIGKDEFLSIDGVGAYNGIKVLMKEKKSNESQKWYLKNIKDNLYEIRYALNPSKVLDVYGDKKVDGTNVITYTANSNDNQRWFLIRLKDDRYKLISKSSHLTLTIDSGYAKIYSNSKDKKQSFNINSTDAATYGRTINDGYYIIGSSLNKSMVLDVYNGDIVNGTNVILFSGHDAVNQIWKIKYLDNGLYLITSAMNPKGHLLILMVMFKLIKQL